MKYVKLIEEALSEFHNADLNNSSTRGWISSEISKKIEDEQYELQKSIDSGNTPVGAFEQQMREDSAPENVESRFNKMQDGVDKSLQESLAKREELQKNKPKPQKKQKVKRSESVPKPKDFIKDFKNLKGDVG